MEVRELGDVHYKVDAHTGLVSGCDGCGDAVELITEESIGVEVSNEAEPTQTFTDISPQDVIEKGEKIDLLKLFTMEEIKAKAKDLKVSIKGTDEDICERMKDKMYL